ncbi:hypothetical protein [Ponticaulis profundi]|uniref:Uncharacterized protein n=1 Tax=Ponticaulis profundi TaxID=2665222 RepID=A0ABW1SAF4_9PROT
MTGSSITGTSEDSQRIDKPDQCLQVDGMMSGTGIKDLRLMEWMEPEELGLSSALAIEIEDWISRYASIHYRGFKDKDEITAIDQEGLLIAKKVQSECPNRLVRYCSAADLVWMDIP